MILTILWIDSSPYKYLLSAFANLNPQNAQIILKAHYDQASQATLSVLANLSALNAQRKLNVTSIIKLIMIIEKSSLFQLSLK